MHWIAPSEINIAYQFRANGLTATQYSQPVFRLVFLRAEVRVAVARTGRRRV